MSQFKLISSTNLWNNIPVKKYVSDKTGLTVILSDVEGPNVNGFFVLPMDNHVFPLILKNTIFLGSELYPYKGVLDLLGNSCLASGTYARIETDYIYYSLTTVGSEGFLSLLPIYLDHILYPTLSDAGFITEVHHVTGEGEDAGVFYREMEEHENSGEKIGYLKMIQVMFPDSRYNAEAGEILNHLRSSVTNEKVRDYHTAYYRPENLFVIITGQVSPEDVFRALDSVEDRIIQKGKLPPFQRPWQTPVVPLESSKDFKIYYPSDKEDCCQVLIGWPGPKAGRSKMSSLTACSVMLRYLCKIYKIGLVEIPDPYATQIEYNASELCQSLLYLKFKNVPVKKIEQINDKLQQILYQIVSGYERIDMERMRNIIHQNITELLYSLEIITHEFISEIIIKNCLYGNSDEEELEDRLNPIKHYEELRECDESFWIELTKKYLIDGHHVLVKSIPSIKEQNKCLENKRERIAKQCKQLGETALLLKAKELNEAKIKNDTVPPNELLLEVNLPETKEIQFHSVKIYRTGSDENPTGIDMELFPIYTEVYDIHTNVVHLISTMNTATLPQKLRPYAVLFIELLTQSSVRHDDIVIPHKKFIAELKADTILYNVKLGLNSTCRFCWESFSHTASITLQIESKNYIKGANWMTDLLHNTEFQIERIKNCIIKILDDITESKENGYLMTILLLFSMFYNEESNVIQCSMLRQQKFLTSLLERLEDPNISQSIIDNLNEFRSIVTDPENLSLHIAADCNKISEMGIDLNEPWLKIAKGSHVKRELNIHPDWKIIKFEGNFPKCDGSIVGIASVENAYLFQGSPGIKDFMDSDLPALKLFLRYLTQSEGPLYKKFQEKKLCQSFNMLSRPNEGLIYFGLYSATNVVAAYEAAKYITQIQLSENVVWDKNILVSAKNSLTMEIVESEENLSGVVVQSFLSSFRRVPIDYNKLLIQRISEVTENDLLRVGKLYVALMFSDKAKTSITCHPNKVNDISMEFKHLGYNFNTVTCLDESFLWQF